MIHSRRPPRGGAADASRSEVVAVSNLDQNFAVMIFALVLAFAIAAITLTALSIRRGRGEVEIDFLHDEATQRTAFRGNLSFGDGESNGAVASPREHARLPFEERREPPKLAPTPDVRNIEPPVPCEPPTD